MHKMFHRNLHDLALIEALTPKGEIITDGLNGKFDPGDNSSYGGSGTTWTNLITGGGDGGDLYLANGLESSFDSGSSGNVPSFGFDGTDDKVSNIGGGGYSSAVEFDFAVGEPSRFTISFWYYPSSTVSAIQALVGVGDVDYGEEASQGLAVRFGTDRKIGVSVFDPDALEVSTSWTNDVFPTQKWLYITVTKETENLPGEDGAVRIYVNGKYRYRSLADETLQWTALSDGACEQPIQFGDNSLDSVAPSGAKIGMILLYKSKALMESEIMSNFLATKSQHGY